MRLGTLCKHEVCFGIRYAVKVKNVAVYRNQCGPLYWDLTASAPSRPRGAPSRPRGPRITVVLGVTCYLYVGYHPTPSPISHKIF